MDANITPTLNEHTGLVTLGIIVLLLIIGIIYNLYNDSEYDENGSKLSVADTFKNMCGLLPIVTSIKNVVSATTTDISNAAQNLRKKIIRQKEVFNIDNNVFTYAQANKVCKAYGAQLATYNQLKKAHKSGANWCNYGWSANKMALYPIQKDFHKQIEASPHTKGTCGTVGVNGGVFDKLDLKFGANCYGYRPYSDSGKIVYEKDPKYKAASTANSISNDNINTYRKLIKRKTIEVRPFNDSKWSKYSFKKSRYMLSPKNPLNIIIENELSDKEKDPRIIHASLKKRNPKVKTCSANLSADVL